MKIFTASDIVEFAERIHENGASFYQYAIQLVNNQGAKDLFAELAEEERQHQKYLEKVFAGMEKNIPMETYTGEYAQYLRNYIDNNIIFTKDALDRGMGEVKDACSAIDFAIQRELDSICYYQGIKELVPQEQHDMIDNLIAEERKHFIKLSDLRRCAL